MHTNKSISRMFSVSLIVIVLLTGAFPVQAAPVNANDSIVNALSSPAIFTDVSSAHWAYSWIMSLYDAGITGGCSTSPLMYCPESTVTRAQMAIFILRGIHGSAYIPPAATGTVFSDVPADAFAANWIEQLAAEGITGGCGTGNYCPDATITRAQMAIFLLRGEHGSAYIPPSATGTVFTDVPTDAFAADWIEQLASEGVTSGCGGGNYCPDANVTRAEMAVFLVRTFSLPITPLSPIIPPTTKVLPSTTTQYLTSVSSDGVVFTFAQTTTELSALAPGEIMAGDASPAAPYGFLRKVTSVSSSSGKVIVQTEPTTIEEAIQQGEVAVSQALSPANAASATFADGVQPMDINPMAGSFYIQLNDVVLYDADGNENTASDQITANGSVSLDPKFDFKLKVQDYQMKELYFTMTTNETSQLKISSKVGVTAKVEKVLVTYPMGPLFLTIGPFPVTVYPILTVVAGIDGTISANVSTGVTQTLTETVGASYANNNWSPIQEFSNQFQYDEPTLTTSLNFKAYAGTKLQIMLYGSVGPEVSLNLYLELEANPLQTPWWELYGGLEVPVSVSVEIFSHTIVEFSAVVIDYRILLAQAGGVVTGTQANKIAAGWSHTCAVTTSGGVKCWGYNSIGQLGDGTTINSLVPVDVSGLSSGVIAIAAGFRHTCALTSSGGVKCWGDNGLGQLGDDTKIDSTIPVDVVGLSSGVIAIATSSNHTCALITGGGVKCWGYNQFGQLGDGTVVGRPAPVSVSGLSSGVTEIAIGEDHTCAVITGGGVKCWGRNAWGQLGDNTNLQYRSMPVDVIGLTSEVTAITAGLYHTCALTINGGAKCWGGNATGELGDGTTIQRPIPVDVSGLTSNVKAITAGVNHTCALTTSGSVKCWGYNFHGQLGDGTTTNHLTPITTNGLASGAVAVATGDDHNCVLVTSGGIMCWGYNIRGQLGDGTTTDRHIPVSVIGFGP